MQTATISKSRRIDRLAPHATQRHDICFLFWCTAPQQQDRASEAAEAAAAPGKGRDHRAPVRRLWPFLARLERIAGTVRPTTIKPDRTDEDKLVALRRAFKESKPIQREDEAYRYLAGRGLRLYDLPECIRTHPGMAYRDDGKVLGTFAVMLATVTDATGRAVSMHRTFIQDGRKAPVPAPKKLMQGLPLAGAAIRLTPISRTLGIAEGIETALAASELFEVPTWSCISTSGIESFEPPQGVEHVVIFADNDANFAGQAAAYRAVHRLALKGIEVEVVIPPDPGDWLDQFIRTERRPDERPTESIEGDKQA